MKSQWTRIGAVAAFFCITSLACLAENAQVPYQFVYNILKTKERLSHSYTNLAVTVVMRSQNPAVNISDLDVNVQSKGGSHAVLLGPNGEFTVPVKEEWLADQAMIVVNQPRGTMSIGFQFGFAFTDASQMVSKQMRYVDMMKWVKDLRTVQMEMAKVAPGAASVTPQAMKLVFRNGKQGEVTLSSQAGGTNLKPEADGSVVIPITEALFAQNPEVLLSSLPEKVEMVPKKGGN